MLMEVPTSGKRRRKRSAHSHIDSPGSEKSDRSNLSRSRRFKQSLKNVVQKKSNVNVAVRALLKAKTGVRSKLSTMTSGIFINVDINGS